MGLRVDGGGRGAAGEQALDVVAADVEQLVAGLAAHELQPRVDQRAVREGQPDLGLHRPLVIQGQELLEGQRGGLQRVLPQTRRRTALLVLRLLDVALAVAGLAALGLGLAQQSEPPDPSLDVGDLAQVRIRASAADAAAPFFLGIAPTDRVRDYLRDVRHDELLSLHADPPGVTFRTVDGRLAPLPPGDQRFWSAGALGSGNVATLEWDERPGAWSPVVMAADGNPGLLVRADVGLRFAVLLSLGAALLAAGPACSSASFLVRGGRRVRVRS